MANYPTQAGGIQIGNIGQVEDVEGRRRVARRGLETQLFVQGNGPESAEHIACGEGSAETDDQRAGSFAFLACDSELSSFLSLNLHH